MTNKTKIYKAVLLGGSWIAEYDNDTWTGKYYATKKGAEKSAQKYNKAAGLV
jgi:hypothetical protein|tara:strand:+ start:904 stop:1059 length:156 start_codon:yes stop_codon:yes gene_type:complete